MKKELLKRQEVHLLESKAKKFLDKPYARILIPNEDGTYTAEMLEFTGCITEGETPQEAIKNLESAALSWIQINLEKGRPIPAPCNDYDHSGKVLLRFSKSLHQQAARMAEREGCSLNQFIVTAVAARVGISDLINRVTERLTNKIIHINANISITATANTTMKGIQLKAEPKMMSLVADQHSGATTLELSQGLLSPQST